VIRVEHEILRILTQYCSHITIDNGSDIMVSISNYIIKRVPGSIPVAVRVTYNKLFL